MKRSVSGECAWSGVLKTQNARVFSVKHRCLSGVHCSNSGPLN